jgi:DNA polymerase elongation subunit (family B)
LTDVNTIRQYNLNDVLITEQLYYRLLDRLKLRAEISELYDINCYTESDSGVANRILEKFYSETTGLEKKYFKDLRTERKFVKFEWVIFPDINFHTETLMTLLEQVRDHTYYKDQPFFKKSVVFDGVGYKLGVGGLHSVDKPAIFEETETTCIIDADIASMYPATAINHNLYPDHLGSKFMKNFRELRDKRIKAKREGRKAENECLKLVLNSAIGKTLNPHLWLYDPIVNLRVTINGQLYILMLIEQLVLNGFKVISANTDGITTLVDKDKKDLYYKVCKEWMSSTQYELEYTYYKKYVRRDVNNYLAIKEDSTVKCKGIFLTEIDLAKGYDQPIISIALYEYFVNGKPIEDTINNHTDIYDFCTAKKIDNKFTNEFHTSPYGEPRMDILQKSVRYYVSWKGGRLLKVDRERGDVEEYEVGKKVAIFNNYFESKDYSIDYGYYINKVQKIIDEIINPQLTLF